MPTFFIYTQTKECTYWTHKLDPNGAYWTQFWQSYKNFKQVRFALQINQLISATSLNTPTIQTHPPQTTHPNPKAPSHLLMAHFITTPICLWHIFCLTQVFSVSNFNLLLYADPNFLSLWCSNIIPLVLKLTVCPSYTWLSLHFTCLQIKYCISSCMLHERLIPSLISDCRKWLLFFPDFVALKFNFFFSMRNFKF